MRNLLKNTQSNNFTHQSDDYLGLTHAQHQSICAVGFPGVSQSIEWLHTDEGNESLALLIKNLHSLSSSLHLSGFPHMAALLRSHEELLHKNAAEHLAVFERIQTYRPDLLQIKITIENYIK
jgi:hypothetical protein